jgi:nucleoid-associated protein YgaU
VRIVESDESRLLAPLPRTTGPDATITVLRGDTLWHIAARHLGPGATDAEVALEWPRWHEANRDVIGADADHLVPGQRLRPPARGAGR